MYNGGFNIYANVDIDLQNKAEAIFKNKTGNNTEYWRKFPRSVQPQCAIAILDYNGDVKAIVGARGEKNANRIQNHASQSRRQPGSAIKPLSAYGLAVELGVIEFSTPVTDEPMVSFMIGNGSFRLHASGGDRTGITMAFAAMGLGLALHAFCTRSDKPLASAGLFRNYRMLLSVLFTSAVVILMISVPYAAAMMGFSPLSLWEWGAISVLLLIQLVVWEFPKIYCLVRF